MSTLGTGLAKLTKRELGNEKARNGRKRPFRLFPPRCDRAGQSAVAQIEIIAIDIVLMLDAFV